MRTIMAKSFIGWVHAYKIRKKKHPTQQTAARQCCEHLHWPVEAMKMPSSCRALRCDMDQFRANVNLVLKLFLSYCC